VEGLVVVDVEAPPSDSSVGVLNPTGVVADEVESCCAPPVLCTTPVCASDVFDESVDEELVVVVDDVDGSVDDDVVDPNPGVDADDELEEPLDALPLLVDEVPLLVDEVPDELDEADDEPDELDELEDPDESEVVGPATAIPGMVATADPTPSATANAPTRPT